MVEISIDKAGVARITAKIEKLAKIDYRQPLRSTGDLLKKEAQENIERQGALYQGGGFIRAGGGFANLGSATTVSPAWKPLAASTRKQRVRLGYGAARPILVRSGKLKNGFRIITGSKAVTVENRVFYAKYHQDGGGRLPQRMILGISGKAQKAIKQIFDNYIKQAIGK